MRHKVVKVNRLKDEELDEKLKKLVYQKDSRFYRNMVKERLSRDSQ